MIPLGHLDVNVVTHCQNFCAGCSHASPWAKPYYMTAEVLRRDLAVLKPFVHVNFIPLVGGEPLLHPKIVELLTVAREAKIASDIIIITNGRLIRRMPKEFWAARPSLQISQYPNLDPAEIAHAEKMAKEYGFSLTVRGSDKFWKQFQPSDGSSFYTCHWKDENCYTVHEGRFYLCPQSCFFPERFMGLPAGIDGLPLEGLTEEKLAAFMARTEPFNACRICRSCAILMDWHQCATEEEWIKDSTI